MTARYWTVLIVVGLLTAGLFPPVGATPGEESATHVPLRGETANASGVTEAVPGPTPQATPAGNLTDNTSTTNTTRGLRVEIVDLEFENPGNVSTVFVGAGGGSSATGVNASDIDTISVGLYGPNGTLIAHATDNYTGSFFPGAVNFSAGNITGVGEVRVTATVSDDAADGNVIDAKIRLEDAGLNGNTIDTSGTQRVAITDTGLLRGEVTDTNTGPVGNVSVQIIDLNTGTAVRTVETRADGTFGSINAPPNPYTAEYEDPLFRTFSTQVVLEANETEKIFVTIERIEYADRITVTPSRTPLTDSNATFVLTVYNQTGGPLGGTAVSANVTPDSDPSVAVLNQTVHTNTTGQATVTVTGNETATATLQFEANNATGGPNATATAAISPCEQGDANVDGSVKSGDATLTLRKVVGLSLPATFTVECADVSGDGSIKSGDATLILRKVVGLPI